MTLCQWIVLLRGTPKSNQVDKVDYRWGHLIPIEQVAFSQVQPVLLLDCHSILKRFAGYQLLSCLQTSIDDLSHLENFLLF